ncbi:MAG: hypothetical protein RIT11_1077 [Pseudomonadota bacterium]
MVLIDLKLLDFVLMTAKLFFFFNTVLTYLWPSSLTPFIAKKIPLFETSLLSIATLLKNNFLFMFELKTKLISSLV